MWFISWSATDETNRVLDELIEATEELTMLMNKKNAANNIAVPDEKAAGEYTPRLI